MNHSIALGRFPRHARASGPAAPAAGARVAAFARAWSYAGGKRDLRLDLMRGFAAFVMVVDHIAGRTLLTPITGANLYFVSAAEAFVVISGLVMGMVYAGVVARDGLGAALLKALRRAWELYLLTVFLTLAFGLTSYALGLWWTPQLTLSGIPRYVLEVVTLHRTTFLADIMLMYTFLLVLAVPVLVLVAKGYARLALLASVAVWAAWQVEPGVVGIWHIEENYLFNLAAWQVLFVAGIAFGFNRGAIEAVVRGLPRFLLGGALLAVIAAVAWLYYIQVTGIDALRENDLLYGLAFAKENVPVGRIAVLALLGAAAYTLLTGAWVPLRRLTGWLLLPLGQNALMAYTVHVFVVALTTKTWLTLRPEGFDVYQATALQLAGVAAVWLVVRFEPAVRASLAGAVRAAFQPAPPRRATALEAAAAR